MTEREALQKGLERVCPQIHAQAVDKLLAFSARLREKNKVMNLTAVTDPMEIITRHFLDCAVLAPYMPAGEKVIDVGTGAGFPGIPLAILCPDTTFVLLDSLRKRIDFLDEVICALELRNVTAVHARAEEFAHEHREGFSAAVSRAVANLSMLSELALPLVSTGGAFLAMKAEDCAAEVQKAQPAIDILGGGAAELIPYRVPLSDMSRVLVSVKKLSRTPEKYPRRFAKISAQPLGGK